MDEPVLIRQRYRDEFEANGVDGVKRHIAAALMDGEKLKHARAWIDEKENGEERQYRARQLILQERNDQRGYISLAFSFIALLISGFALYRTWPESSARSVAPAIGQAPSKN